MLDQISLECFLYTAELGSFTKAGNKIGRTQSAVSQQISNLEQIIGFPLFIRGKETKLTLEGEMFLGYARKIVALQREVVDRFKQPELEGEVRFGLPEDFASIYLSDVLAEFSKLHPRILLNVECDLTYNLYERFRRNEFDLVLVKMSQPEDFPNGLEIWSEGLEWVSATGAIDLAHPVPLVLSPSPCVYRQSALKALESTGIQWRVSLTSSSYTSKIAAVKAGLGITALPVTMVPRYLHILPRQSLPQLEDIHVSLIKHQGNNDLVNSLEGFVLNKFRRG